METRANHRGTEAQSRSAHTPGPWVVENYGDGDARVIHSDGATRICFMATAGSNGDPARISADARLIAAAPEMLAALRAIRDRAAETAQTNATREIVRWCGAAIAKAEDRS